MIQAFDYIYTGAFCGAILSWSIVILFTRKLETWIGWLGILLFLIAVGLFISGLAVNSLQGFRAFVAIILIWILLAGMLLYKESGLSNKVN